jgi:hypothetical protein
MLQVFSSHEKSVHVRWIAVLHLTTITMMNMSNIFATDTYAISQFMYATDEHVEQFRQSTIRFRLPSSVIDEHVGHIRQSDILGIYLFP